MTGKPKTFLLTELKNLILQKDKYFGNARTVRKMVEEAIKNQNLRLAKLKESERKNFMINRIELEDVKSVGNAVGEAVFDRKRIGF